MISAAAALRPRQDLRSNPDFASVGADVHGAVHRLHRGVGKKRHLVDGIDLFGCASEGLFDVAVLSRYCARFLRGCIEVADDIGGREPGVRTGLPFDFERCQAFLRGSHMIGYNSHGVLEPHHLMDALHRSGLVLVDALQCPAEHRTDRKGCDLHARQSHIDAISSRPIDLAGRVEPFDGLSDDIEILRFLEHDFRCIGDR